MSHGLADFSKKLQLVLDALSTSRSQLAHDLGVHKSLVARWVAGDVTPTEHNLSRLTLLIKQTRPDFSLAVWRHDVVAFAEAVGVSRREIERLSGGSAPAAPARSPESSHPIGLPLQGPILARESIRREAANYEGFYRMFRQAFANSGIIVMECLEIRRTGEDLGFRCFDGWYRHSGFILPMRGQLFFIGEETARMDECFFLVVNGIAEPRAMVLDGILLTVAGDRSHTPSATVMVMQFAREIRQDAREDEDVWTELCNETLSVNTEHRAADLIPEELRVAVKNSVGISRNDGQFDWVLRVPGERSVSAGNTGY
jgi:hypothetical protein